MDVRPTWVDRLPGRLRWQRAYAMLQPLAFGGLRVRDADTLLSFASFGAKAVPAPPGRAPPLLLLYAPPLPLGPGQRDRPRAPAGARPPGQRRRWSATCAGGTSAPRGGWSRFITQSRYVAGRIRRVYGREAEVIPPPVDVQRFAAVTPRDGGYFLIVSRFEAYKRIDLAIRACRRWGRAPAHRGDGVDEARLREVPPDGHPARALPWPSAGPGRGGR